MTTERAAPDSPHAESGSRGPSPRVLLVLALAVLAGGAWIFRKPLFFWSMWINGADRKEYSEKLEAEQDPAILSRLEDGMRDADKGDLVRLSCANLLLAKNRLPVVEAALRDARLDVRAIALAALGNLKHFQSEYVDNPAYEVQKTLLAWIADPRVPGRARGIGLVPKVFRLDKAPPPELIATLRAALKGADGAGATDARVAAAGKLAAYKDCASAAEMLALSASESDPYARWHILSSTVLLYDAKVQLPDGSYEKRPDGTFVRACPDVPEPEVRKVVLAALGAPGEGDRSRGLRLGAMSIVGRHPEWAPDALERIRGALADPAVHEVERRTALDTLVTLKDEPTLDRFERWCHDPAAGVRATATSSIFSKAPGLDPNRLLSCVVGYLRDEPPGGYELTFHMAFAYVREKAGEWVGLPGAWRKSSGSLGAVQKGLETLLRTGSLDGATRLQVGDALFRWLCKTNGLGEPETDAAAAARATFWEKAKAGDAAGARAVYDASMQKNVNLWTYELGWLEAHAK